MCSQVVHGSHDAVKDGYPGIGACFFGGQLSAGDGHCEALILGEDSLSIGWVDENVGDDHEKNVQVEIDLEVN